MQDRRLIPRRATIEASTHRAGHHIGTHPEDVPYLSDQRKRYPDNPLDLADDLDYPDEPTRMPTSARHYVNAGGQQVIWQGNRRIVIHSEPPPRRRSRMHWSAILGAGMTIMILMFAAWTLLGSWWADHQLDATYGFPRTYQTGTVVGHDDSADHPTHFIFLNLNGHVIITELPGGDVTKAKIYSGPQIFTDNPASVPVTGEFKDINGDGKLDMIVHIGDQRIIYLNDGTQFKPQS